MKKYWKIVILPLFIVITFGVLYVVHHAIAKEGLPQFELVNVSGDEETGEDIIVYGDYVTDESSVWESFRLSSDGIMYSSERNFLEQFNAFFQPQEIELLIKEERNFMRGKEDSMSLYVEDGERIAYAGPSNLHFESKELEVDVLDRESRERKTFKVDIPGNEKTNHMYVEQVHLQGDTLSVITVNYIGEETELHAYEVSLNDETIEDKGAIVEDSVHSSFHILRDSLGVQRQDDLVVRVDDVEWNEGMYTSEVVGEEYFIYDLETNEKQVIEVPEEFAAAEEEYRTAEQEMDEEVFYPTNYTSTGNKNLYFIIFTSDGMKYYPYRLDENKLGEEKEISFDEGILSGLSGVYTKGDHLYFYSNAEEDGNQMKKLFKVDLVNGEIVYEGDIRLTDAPKETHVYNVEVFNVEEKR